MIQIVSKGAKKATENWAKQMTHKFKHGDKWEPKSNNEHEQECEQFTFTLWFLLSYLGLSFYEGSRRQKTFEKNWAG